jgi:hypothetical protein
VHTLEVGSPPSLVLSVGHVCSAQLPRDFISFRRKRDTPAPNADLVDAGVPLKTRQAAYDDGEVSGGGQRDDAAIRGSENTQSSFLALVLRSGEDAAMFARKLLLVRRNNNEVQQKQPLLLPLSPGLRFVFHLPPRRNDLTSFSH